MSQSAGSYNTQTTDAAAAAPTAPGSTDLSYLLASLSPSLSGPVYVFCTFPRSGPPPPAELPAIFRFEEAEGTTVVAPRDDARRLLGDASGDGSADGDKNSSFFFPCRCVTLTVHSSLEAVGMLAAITTHLARDLHIGVNPVSAFHHDHLFVPEGSEQAVLQSLERLAAEAGRKGEE